MFTTPRLEAGEKFPQLPIGHPNWQELLDAIEVSVNPAVEDPLLTLTRHAIGWVEGDPAYAKPWHNVPIQESEKTPALEKAGLVRAIDPQKRDQDYVCFDGGHLSGYKIRLDYADAAQRAGLLETSNIILFGGQRLRTPRIDSFAKLAQIAESLRGNVDEPTEKWLAVEMSKDPTNPSPWLRPFPTERELGRISLSRQYKKALRYRQTIDRPDPKQLHETIPIAWDAADEFDLGGQRIVILNAPAIIREHAGRKCDISQARPTGRSCFFEWTNLEAPPESSSVMLATSAPNIYRSWFDMLLGANKIGRQDLEITAAGPGVVRTRTIGHVLVGLGDLFINFYSLKYEGDVIAPDAPLLDTTPR
jgi:hypothetical protein